ncbi:hypothetical protein BFU36_06355 [Sulfolobus sp. A20]|uniref:ATP-binding protein n=1 Tax=Saccharolobus sp. A20 TaxID=1891280 RepID=UPI0008461BCB|nr:ATP-binding protein [Sulfolobus sp. A20]TRM76322.1 ATP-binding protein [Sulfolobus sp. A20-N-F8]TRM84292.1 ATP-binding protein [Sulfolobus sp. A20-N-F6]TRM89625.1 ATP-binding protein [Sulfolobus sp. C3]TRM94708.1 ATP-binding protein [Sulfolobus sp. A20-N-G8]TRM99730.1 ATP-binding protein [Sulfolobus sp. F1]
MEEEEKLISEIREKVVKAEEDAKNLSANNNIVGRVTRYETVKVGERNYIGVDINFEDYVKSYIKMDEYLGIRTIIHPVLIIGRVVSIARSDMLAQLRIKEITSYPHDPATIMTDTFIEIEPIAEKDLERSVIRPAVSPVDPQSPVIKPKAEVLEEILRIPRDGINIGKIYSGGEELEGTKVILDEEILRHHVLLIGTTGSGKTTLLKTIVGDPKSNVVVFDRQGDFVRYSMDKLGEFTVIMPVTKQMVENVITSELPLVYGEEFARRYGCSFPTETDVRDNEEILVDCKGKILHLIPFTIKFGDVFSTLYKIAPYMSEASITAWDAITRKFSEKLNTAMNVLKDVTNKDVIEKLKEDVFNRLEPDNLLYLDLKLENIYKLRTLKKDYVDIGNELITIKVNKIFEEVLEELDLARQTKDAIHRVLRALRESGIFNVKGAFTLSSTHLSSNKIVVDLSWVLDFSESPQALATLSYKILSDLYNWKDKLYKAGKSSSLTLLIMDEAHEYFPQTNRVEASKEIVEGLINRLMRLGRVRNLGVILATHTPEDLNNLIIQLTNTKIVMRNDVSILKKLGFEDYVDVLQVAPPGVAVVRSTKFSDVIIRTLIK